jgi:3-hydroxyisobutyrate dehydrogenase-like beta-hydroxyacid dehydrogenase
VTSGDKPLRVGIVGTGEMGRPLVDRLLRAGHRVAAYARRPDRRADLAEAGVEVVESVPALGRGRDIVLIYVYSDDQVREVAIGDGLVDAMARGSVLVIHTTGSPGTAEVIAARAGPGGVGVVDAPGSGGPAVVASGTLTLFVGGARDHVERCLPLFESYARHVVRLGPLGSGQKAKLINNLLFGAHVQLAVEAARLSERFEIDAAALAKTLHHGSGASAAIDLMAAMGSADALLNGAGRFIYKDVLVARALAAELDTPLGAFDSVLGPLLERTAPR